MLTFLAAPENGEAHNPVLPLWEEIVVGALAFTVLCYILIKYVFPRMEQTFRARVDEIEGGIERAKAAQAEANQLLERYREQLAEARTEAARIRDEARADAAGIREEATARAREEADRIIQAGRDSLAAERGQIVRELRAELGGLAVELASRIVGEALADEARQRGTVERFLSELGESGPEPATTGGKR
jgi:F-type H+-transporting ATPase subunit b